MNQRLASSDWLLVEPNPPEYIEPSPFRRDPFRFSDL